MLPDPDGFALHDVALFPIVHASRGHVTPGYAAQWVVEMEALLRHGRPFVLIFPDGQTPEEHEDRKRRGQWLKANKQALAALCLSLITVEPDAGKRLALETQMAMATKAFGIPMDVAASLSQAHGMAQALIAQTSQSESSAGL